MQYNYIVEFDENNNSIGFTATTKKTAKLPADQKLIKHGDIDASMPMQWKIEGDTIRQITKEESVKLIEPETEQDESLE